MADKNKYLRKFIILDNKEVDSLKGSNPKGYVKLEARDGKGKILFNVEGLERDAKSKRAYRGYLLSKNHGRTVWLDLGSIITNEKGKGSLEWQFNPDSVGETKLPIEAFNIVLVKLNAVEGSSMGASIPLAGYIQNNDGTIAAMARELKQDKVHVHDEKLKEIKEEIKEEAKEETQADYEEYIEEKQPEIEEQKIEVEEVKTEEIQELEIKTEIEDLEEVEEVEEVEEIQLETDEQLKPMEAKEAKPVEEKEYSEEDYLYDVSELEDVIDPSQYKSEYTEEDKSQFIDIEDNLDKYFVDVNTDQNIEEDIQVEAEEIDQEDISKNLKYDQDKETYGYSVNQGYDYIENARNYSKQIANYTMNILKFFQKVNPFSEGLKEYTWWEIEYDRKNIFRGFLPFYNYIVSMYYPYPSMSKVTTCQTLIQKYDHYIFGMVEDNKEVKYYVYGIPGRFTKEDQPYKGMTGFQTWLRRKGRNRDEMGYWLIHIDAISGKIVNPLPPTPVK